MNQVAGIVLTAGALICTVSMGILLVRLFVLDRRAQWLELCDGAHPTPSAPAPPSAPARAEAARAEAPRVSALDSFPPVFARPSRLPSAMPPLPGSPGCPGQARREVGSQFALPR